jgi:hypothetical protein
MHETNACFHNLEWPAPGARLAGPVVWLRGWIVGKPGHDFIDVRVRHGGATHLGVLGLPRVDLAAHFKSARAWLPAEFILGVPLPDGDALLALEVMDAHGRWHLLGEIPVTVAPDGLPAPRVEGRLETSADGTWTVRDAHHPFHGHLDQPGPTPEIRHGRAPVFGWLLDETKPLAAVLATTDTLVFNHLAHSLTDDALAAKFPQHAGARHARLRGAVDFPATLAQPACLRVYAVSPDGAVTLCFAQRLTSAKPSESCNIIRYNSAEAALSGYETVAPRELSPLPSGRPRRLLIVLRTLWPDDATLRALDLARHLVGSHAWAARVVSTEDGPLRRDFEQTNVESLIVNPEPLLAARDEAAMRQALDGLKRQIWWGHLDAVAFFDPICAWVVPPARQLSIPVLFDCDADEPMDPDPTAIPAVQSLLRAGWREAAAICFASAAAARAQQGHLAGRPAVIIPQWHSPILPGAPSAGSPRVAFAPLRTTDWLKRQHPEVAARWNFRQGPAGLNSLELLVRQDDQSPPSILQHSPDWSLHDVSLCLGPLFGRGPLRPVLDAAATGRALAAPRTPTTEEWFAVTRLPLVAEDNPLALAHALLAFDSAPDLHRRESEAAAELIRAQHSPQALLARWTDLLASVAATRG